MKEELTTDENSRFEREESSLGRRDYLRLTTTAGVIGLGSSAFAGQASADSEPKRTLTIEGTGPRVTYEFSVGGNVVKSTAMGASINANDTISGQTVSGEVGSGKDSYSFSGELTAFSMNGDARLYLNGEPLSDTVTVEDDSAGGPIHYELRVDGEVLKSTAMSASIDNNDEITPRDDPDSVEPITDAEPLAGETYALGQVNGARDSYSISGDITGFTANGSVNLYVNGELVTHPGKFVRTTLTFESKNGNRADYTFSTSGDISKSRAMGATINASDTAESGGASGYVTNGRDSYAYTGEITDFSGSSNLRVYLSRKQIDPATLSADPQFENTLTIEGNGGHTAYHFAVEGSLAENYGLSDEDSLDGNVANGRVRSGQDSYTFSGDISTFTADPEKGASFTTYLNGSEVDPETLGHVQTTPDAEDLPNEVRIRALTDARTEYGFGVSGTLVTGERSNTYSGDNASYEYARGWVKGEGLDNYKFSGEVRTLTDFDTFQIDIDREAQTISIEDFGSSGQTNYEITVSGKMSKTPSSSASTVSGGTATGGIDGGTDVYKYTGVLQKFIISDILQVDLDMRPAQATGTRRLEFKPDSSSENFILTIQFISQDFKPYIKSDTVNYDSVTIPRKSIPSEHKNPDESWVEEFDDVGLFGRFDEHMREEEAERVKRTGQESVAKKENIFVDEKQVQSMSDVNSSDRPIYTGPLYTYQSADLDERTGPINLAWEKLENNKNVNALNVDLKMADNGWTSIYPAGSSYIGYYNGERYEKKREDGSVEKMDGFVPGEQWHGRLYDIPSTAYNGYSVICAAHHDPLDHGQLRKLIGHYDNVNWRFNDSREKIIHAWKDYGYDTAKQYLGNGDGFNTADGYLKTVINFSGEYDE